MSAEGLLEVVPALVGAADERDVGRVFVIRLPDDARVSVRTAPIVNERELLKCQKEGKVRFVGFTGHKSPHIH